MTHTLLEFLDQFPPIMVRVMAHTKAGYPFSIEDIARISGLPLHTVRRVSRLDTWDKIPVGVASKFMKACGLDPCHAKRWRDYIKRSSCPHVHRNTPVARELRRLIKGHLCRSR